MGRAIEPVLKPLGFDWKIGIGIVTSFAAREVFVSTLSIVYNAGTGDEGDSSASLARVMQSERREDGRPMYTPLTGLTLMVFYVFAMQCVSTVAVVRRETNSWKWPVFQTVYMTSLAWLLAFVTHQVGTRLGF
jgi:ferrous iron transport protein B